MAKYRIVKTYRYSTPKSPNATYIIEQWNGEIWINHYLTTTIHDSECGTYYYCLETAKEYLKKIIEFNNISSEDKVVEEVEA